MDITENHRTNSKSVGGKRTKSKGIGLNKFIGQKLKQTERNGQKVKRTESSEQKARVYTKGKFRTKSTVANGFCIMKYK